MSRPEQVAELTAAYQAVYSSPEGRRVLDDLMDFAGVERVPFVADSPTRSAFVTGQFSVGRRIRRYITGKEKHGHGGRD